MPAARAGAASGGRALDRGTAQEMSARFGHDFSSVRIHTDARAEDSAEAMGANAYTFGTDIVFGAGQYTPGSRKTERLLAHELTHVVQQSESGPGDPARASHANDASEHEADDLASQVLMGRNVRVRIAPGAAVARSEADDGQPDRAAVLEQAAHVLSYEHFDKAGNRENSHDPVKDQKGYELEEQKHAFAVAMMEKAGYDVESKAKVGDKEVEKASSPTVEGVDGFGMRTFMPKKDKDGQFQQGVSPIVSFRGTETRGDWYNDLSAQHVGADPFRENKDLIGQQMAAASQAGPVTLTGHSLGGAHAQEAAVAFPDMVGDVTTFQSPGIRRSEADAFDAENAARVRAGRPEVTSEHYRSSGDIVPWAGEKMTRGSVTTYGNDIPFYDVATPHKSLPFTTYESQQGGIPPLTGADGKPVANPYAPGGGSPTFKDPKTISTDQEYAQSNGVPEILRSGIGLGIGAYEEGKWNLQKGSEMVSGVGGALANGADWGAGKIGEAGQGAYNAGAQAASWTADRTGQAFGGTATAAGQATQWLGGKASEAGNGLYNAGSSVAGWVGGKGTEAAQGVGGFIQNVSEARSVGDGIDRVGAGLGSAGQWMTGTAGQAARGVGDSVGSSLNWAGKTGKQALAGTAGAASQAAGWMNHTAHEAAAGVGQAATGALGWLDQTAGQAGQGLQSATHQAGSWLGGVGTEIGHGLSRAGDDISGFGSAVWNGLGHLGDALIPPAH